MAARPLSRLVRRCIHAASFSSSSTLGTVSPRRMDDARFSAACKEPQSTLAELVFHPQKQSNTSNGINNNYTHNPSHSDDANARFEAAVERLNSLQSNDATIRSSVKNNNRVDTKADTVKFLERSGLPLETVERLSIIHVAGTKGKGSTCALTESLLRHCGARTGFFSSPHILSINERIRIDGQLLAKEQFTEHFWRVYNRLWELREHEHDMPAYFKFLTILGFHIFVAEQVDVVVLEVGIGGELDSTNILRNVRTVGITSLGLEHTELLGKTLEEIAWQKAGIIKPGSHVYTHVAQPECLKVIRERAQEKGAILFEVPPTEDYFRAEEYTQYWESINHVIRLNGSLAIQLASDWLSQATTPPKLRREKLTPNEVRMDQELMRGLANTHWPGRCQLVEWRGLRLHLDGAHTLESMEVCTDWFAKSIAQSDNPKILIFNRTGMSGFGPMLELLDRTCRFDLACFVPNLATSNPNAPSQVMVRFSAEMQLKRAKEISMEWSRICESRQQEDRGQVYDTLSEAFNDIRRRFPAKCVDVLVTGSIHLLGAAISALDLIDRSPK